MVDFFESLSEILFLDIETASGYESIDEVPERVREEWLKKEELLSKTDADYEPGSQYFERAGIYAEFGQVISVGVGYILLDRENELLTLRTKVFSAPSERELLEDFKALLEKKNWTLCAHNGKEFDFPYLSRRMLINGVSLPEPLQMAGKKPWEIRHLDTLELWKFGDYKHYTRLELLASIFDIPSSKDDLDGSQVNHTYHIEKDMEKINKYCLRDVEVTARVYLAMNPQPQPFTLEVIAIEE
ncbi:3'-5' exonuclease [Algoriphagus sediminis]|uniref:3'-5' exonuclease n=1 Tax=Algoriphagus sediminis TaxID=3057113 RepID=A0ABT7YH75_9BACT|nr:3'-5' exonuclease [Algoriphagus sediminis]MDN3205878.1 3'-5' exonuclease [Algoriphagus sediminis]